MPSINFRYTKNGVVKTTKYFEYGYPTFAFVDDIENEVVYLTKVAKTNGSSVTEVFDNENGVTFDENYIYLVDVKDLEENAIVEGRRIYSVNDVNDPQPYGISGKDKRMVPVIPMNGIAIIETYVSSSTQIAYPEGFNRKNTVVLSLVKLDDYYDAYGYYTQDSNDGYYVKLYDDYILVSRANFKNAYIKLVLMRSDI